MSTKHSKGSIVVSAVAAAAGVYEFVALWSGDVPTITAMVLALPVVVRAAVIAVVVFATIDHFGTRRWL